MPPPLDARQRKQRQEHEHDDGRGVQDAGAHFHRRELDHLDGVQAVVWVLGAVHLQAAQHVFHIHHRVVHQAAYGNGQAAQRHGVDRQAEILEHQRGDEDGHRNGRERNHRGPKRAQKHEQNHRHKHRGAHELALQGGDRCLDEACLAEGDARRLHAAGQRVLQVRQCGLDAARETDGVGRGLLLDAQDHGALPFKARVAAPGGSGEGRVRHLAQQHALAVFGGEGQVLQVFEPRGAAQVADEVFAPAQLQKPARGVGRKALERARELVVRDAQRCHARRVGQHLKLAHLATDGDHLRHARDGHEARAQHPVGVLAHGHGGGLACVDGDGHLHDLAHDGADGPHAWRDAAGQALFHGRQALRHHLARAVDVGAPVEGDVDERQACTGGGAHALHTRQAVHRGLQREGDELLHLFSGHAARLGHEGDGGFVEVRKHVHRRAREREGAVGHEHGGGDEHQQPVGQAVFEKPLEHRDSLADLSSVRFISRRQVAMPMLMRVPEDSWVSTI